MTVKSQALAALENDRCRAFDRAANRRNVVASAWLAGEISAEEFEARVNEIRWDYDEEIRLIDADAERVKRCVA